MTMQKCHETGKLAATGGTGAWKQGLRETSHMKMSQKTNTQEFVTEHRLA